MRRRGPSIYRPPKKASGSRHKAPPVEVTIAALGEDGRGIAHINKRPVFVADALPGERVEVEITHQRRRHDEGRVLSRLTVSEDRVAPACSLYGQCGGCQLQHLPQAGQRQLKQAQLSKLLRSQGADLPVDVLPSPAYGYRHRARLAYHVGTLGFRGANSHVLVDVEHCALLPPQLNRALAPLKKALSSVVGDTQQVECLLSSHGTEPPRDDIAAVLNFSRGEPGLRRAVQEQLPEWFILADPNDTPPMLQYQLSADLQLAFSPADFTQVNPAVNRQLIARVIQWLSPQHGEIIADYFCGLGNFSIPLAAAGASVRAYDAGTTMIARAQQTATTAGHTIDYRCVDLFDPDQLPPMRDIRKAVIDPPRAGARALCEALAKSRAIEELVYVSCDPSTLERDLHILARGGFHVRAAAVAEMFPQTYHQESVVKLTRS